MGFLSLVIKMGLDATGVERGLKNTESSVTKFSSLLKDKIGKAVAPAAIAAAVTAAVKVALDRAKELKQIRDQFDTTAEETQAMGRAARKSGLEFEQFGGALDKLGEARSSAIESNEKLRHTFSEFGVTLDDLLNPQQRNIDLLQKMGRAMQTMQLTPQQRSDLRDLLGREGSRLGPAVQRLPNSGSPFDLTSNEVAGLNQLGAAIGDKAKLIKNLVTKAIGTTATADWAHFFWTGEGRDRVQAPHNTAAPGRLDDPIALKREAELNQKLKEAYEAGNKLMIERQGVQGQILEIERQIAALEIQRENSRPDELAEVDGQIALKRMELENARLIEDNNSERAPRGIAGWQPGHLNALQQVGAYSGVDPILTQMRSSDSRQIQELRQIAVNTAPLRRLPADLEGRVLF